MKQLFKFALMCTAMVASMAATSCKDPVEQTPEFEIAFAAENGSAKATIDGIEVTKAKEGDIVVIEATPATDYSFTGWSSTTSVAFGSATATQTTFTMPAAAVNITAAFAIDLYVVNFTATADGGTVSVEVAGEAVESGAEIEVGAEVTITAAPTAGYEFGGWSGVTLTDEAALTATFRMPAEVVTLQAAFDKVAAAINFTASATGGTVSVKVAGETVQSGDLVEIGADVTITADPAEGYDFTEWGGVTLADKTLEEVTFEMPAEDVTLTAVFEEIPTYEIVLPTIIGQGTVEVRVDGVGPITGGQRFYAGQSVNIKSIPADGWRFVNFILGGYAISNDDFTYPMPSSTLTIGDATFEEIPTIAPPTQKPTILKPDGTAYGAMAFLSGGQVSLNSSEVEGATGYRWMRSGVVVYEGPEREMIATAQGNWCVQGYNEAGAGPWSAELMVLN